MFGARRRQGQAQLQEEEVPEPGSDSTYGVRSLGDSDFGHSSIGGLTTPVTEQGDENVDSSSPAGVSTSLETTPTPSNETLIDVAIEPEAEASPSSPTITSPALISPTAPEQQVEGYYRHTILDDLSEPSSPASFASMPSYISSSLSRTSSLGPDTGRIPYPYTYGGSEELVMPTMNFAQSQSRGNGKVDDRLRKGVKVVLLGSEGTVGEFLDGLRGHEGVVKLGEGNWTLGADMTFTISSGDLEEIETRVDNAYTTLHGALHPDPSPALRGEVQGLVSSYGLKSDWIHLIIVLDDRDTTSLDHIVPTIKAQAIPQDLGVSVQTPSSPLDSSHIVPDPTPRPGIEGLSYFPSQIPSLHSDLISRLITTLQSPTQAQSASTAKFLTWRQSRRDLSSTHTSTSHSHESSSYEAAPMPTLARAQGGGEWEATLSRRLANRRQPSSSPEESKRGRRRSTVSRPKVGKGSSKESCGPLFPFSSTPSSDPRGSRVGLGISELVEKTFGELRKRWKWGLVAAAAVAIVVGWNWNSGSSVRLSTCI